MAKDRGIYIGPRLRRLRRELGLTQAGMAEDLEISPSYIALIERNQRPLTADLLLRLASTYKIDLGDLTSTRQEETIARLNDVMRDPLLTDIDFAALETKDFAHGYPGFADALLRLYTAYKDSQIALADRGEDAAAPHDPVAEARRFLSVRKNSFPLLDDRAERITQDASAADRLSDYLATHLKRRHGLSVLRLAPDIMAGAVRRFDRHKNRIVLDNTLDNASQAFQLAQQIAYLEMHETVDELISEGSFETDNGRALARRALANYAAAAILMPYRAFVRAAEGRQYDIEALARQFSASFEQIAHRLTTLQKPGQEGVPFFFIRVDAAGNVSKRLDGAGFPFARHGGSCPLWSVHTAFRRPREILTQWVELPDGEAFFSIARTVTAGGGAYGAPRIERAIALGCAAKHANRLIYAKGRDLASETPTPIGATCRLCHRTACTARAEPPIGRQVVPDDYRRTSAPFSFNDR